MTSIKKEYHRVRYEWDEIKIFSKLLCIIVRTEVHLTGNFPCYHLKKNNFKTLPPPNQIQEDLMYGNSDFQNSICFKYFWKIHFECIQNKNWFLLQQLNLKCSRRLERLNWIYNQRQKIIKESINNYRIRCYEDDVIVRFASFTSVLRSWTIKHFFGCEWWIDLWIHPSMRWATRNQKPQIKGKTSKQIQKQLQFPLNPTFNRYIDFT